MKKNLLPLIVVFCFQLFSLTGLKAQIGTWTALTHLEPNQGAGLFLLMTDGTIMVQNVAGGYTGWDKLTPDASGSYLNGTWTTEASMNRPRLFFASQVLPTGKLFVAGGEYYNGDTAGEVYDPVANTWTRTRGVVSRMNIYDGNSILLPNGQVLVGLQSGNNPSFDCQFFNPATNTWALAPTSPLNHDESQWLKLPDSSILFMGIFSTQSCRYRPQTNTWVSDANAPQDVYDVYGEESGCGFLLPNGKGIFFGATKYNDIYTPSGTAAPGTWTSAANFPTIGGTQVGQTDAPGAMLVNGHILLCVSPAGTAANEFQNPAWFMEYDYTTNTFTKVTSPIPGIGGDSIPDNTCSDVTLLNLPDGTVLMMQSQNSNATLNEQYYIYTPGSGPIPQGKPTISTILPDGCPYYKITGKLFNGISEGTEYGDDLQQSSNYPLVRLSNGTNVYYCKTTNWNRLGAVMTDSLPDTAIFQTPAALPSGTYSLVVVVNGFASNPTLFTVLGISSLTHTDASCGVPGGAAVTVVGSMSPYTYSWNPGGAATASVTNLSAGVYSITVTDNNGCTASAAVTITQAGGSTGIIIASQTNISCNGGNNGSVTANIPTGGTPPYTYNWTPSGGTNISANNLIAGVYTITATDNTGCAVTTSATITQPGILNASANAASNVSCAGLSDGGATTTTSGGTLPYTYSWSSGGSNSSLNGLSAGSYNITVSDSCGSTATASVIITEPVALSLTADSSSDDGTCNGSAWIMPNGGTSPYTFLWATGSQTTDTITNQCTGSYCATVTDANGCLESICVTVQLSTGTKKIVSNSGQITVYPNPNNGQFTIHFNTTGGNSSIEIYNVLGQQVYSHINVLNSTFNIDISSQPDGIYFYRMIKENGNLLGDGKIVIQK